MNQLIKLFASSALSFACCTQVQADWNFTSWGMAPADLEAAASRSSIKLVKLNPMADGAFFARYKSPYSAAGFDFEATYSFSDRNPPRLDGVTLKMTKPDFSRCRSLRYSLMDTYGQPKGQVLEDTPLANGLLTATWNDPKAGNSIAWFWFESKKLCQVVYGDPRNGL